MNCANHPEVPASAFCRECGKPMCTECQRPALGSVFCAEHVPVTAAPPPPYAGAAGAAPPPFVPPGFVPPAAFASSPYSDSAPGNSAPVPPRVCDNRSHPFLALGLGFIPGVGALYNGQYAKGLIHAVVFGLLVSMASNSHGSLEPLFGIMITAWVFYMAFEAFHTASKRRNGDAVEEFSSLFDVRPAHGRFPAGAILLIALGFILLLDTTDMIDMAQLERFWPVGLIVFGIYLLYARVTGDRPENSGGSAEARR